MQSLRLALNAVVLVPVAVACSQSGPTFAGGTGGGGGSMSGTGGAMATVDSVAGVPNVNGDKLKDSWMMFPCYAQASQDCQTNMPGTACPNQDQTLPFENQGLQIDQSFVLGGDPNTMYNLTIQVNGITEGKYYENGVRADGDAAPADVNVATGLNTLYTGGNPVNFENYNVYKLTVQDGAGNEIEHYYLNSMPKVATPYENHNSFPEGYTATIPVMGGGTILYHEADRNCRAIDNCGPGSRSTSCGVSAGRNIPNEPDVQIPSTFNGIPMSSFNTLSGTTQPFHAQAIHITVTAVAVAPPI
jgi:hypothetical protein